MPPSVAEENLQRGEMEFLRRERDLYLDEDDDKSDLHCIRNVEYSFETSEEQTNRRINTLLDTGSLVSFIKESFVPEEAFQRFSSREVRYTGINNSKVESLGEVL